MKTEYIMGIPVDVVTLTELLAVLPTDLMKHQKIIYKSVNPQIVTHAHKYPEIVQLVQEATYRIPDGIGIVKASQMQGGQIKERLTGIELMYALLRFADANQSRIFLYGAHPTVVKAAAENITRDYPNLVVADYLDGYTELSQEEIRTKINQSGAQFVFVALGFPKQEQWIAANYQELEAQVFQDVGGSFDVLSGHVKRAPDFFIKTNLEWLYRSLSNPKRIYRIFELPVFMFKSWRWHRKNK